MELAGNDNYNPASATLEFAISQTTNAWTEELPPSMNLLLNIRAKYCYLRANSIYYNYQQKGG